MSSASLYFWIDERCQAVLWRLELPFGDKDISEWKVAHGNWMASEPVGSNLMPLFDALLGGNTDFSWDLLSEEVVGLRGDPFTAMRHARVQLSHDGRLSISVFDTDGDPTGPLDSPIGPILAPMLPIESAWSSVCKAMKECRWHRLIWEDHYQGDALAHIYMENALPAHVSIWSKYRKTPYHAMWPSLPIQPIRSENDLRLALAKTGEAAMMSDEVQRDTHFYEFNDRFCLAESIGFPDRVSVCLSHEKNKVVVSRTRYDIEEQGYFLMESGRCCEELSADAEWIEDFITLLKKGSMET